MALPVLRGPIGPHPGPSVGGQHAGQSERAATLCARGGPRSGLAWLAGLAGWLFGLGLAGFS